MNVYILESKLYTGKYYTGITKDVSSRLLKHNNGEVPHTKKYRPWKLATSIWFENVGKARNFEKYLKSGSGRAFSKRHF